MDKCKECLHSRPIISENGYHPVCCLSKKKTIDCLIGKKNWFATVKKDKNGNLKAEFYCL